MPRVATATPLAAFLRAAATSCSISSRRAALAATTLALCACSTLPPAAPIAADQPHWSGRLALSMDTDGPTPRAFSASFDLYGRADDGTLVLSSPLGQQLVRLVWTARSAELQTPEQTQRYASMDELTQQSVGTPVPLGALFDWLSGRSRDGRAVAASTGWVADLSELDNGKLMAQRATPPATLRVRLDQP